MVLVVTYDRVWLDLYDLTGSHEPVSLSQFLRDNQEFPPTPEELRALRRLGIGQTAHLGIGGGSVKVQRVG
jgi:hypothetical protein